MYRRLRAPERARNIGICTAVQIPKTLFHTCMQMSIYERNYFLSVNIHNNSARKTSVSRLLHAGVQTNTVVQLNGQKNMNSLNRYAIASHDQEKQMSDINRYPIERWAKHPNRSAVHLQLITINTPFSRNAVHNNPVPTLSSQQATNAVAGVFANATITGVTFNFNFHAAGNTTTAHSHHVIDSPAIKRQRPRVVIYGSDDE